jgi:putative redox protein
MGIVARRRGIDTQQGATVTVEKHMNATPRRIGRLPVVLRVPGTFTAEQKKLLVNAAHGCPVHKSLHPDIDATITITWAG